jgi:heterodisulfide reductase subunit A
VEACGAGAVTLETHKEQREILDLEVGSVILAPGFTPYDPSGLDFYGYGKYPNVITSMQFERLLSASGPTEGHVARPSDHKDPKKSPGSSVSGPVTRTVARMNTALRFAACTPSRRPSSPRSTPVMRLDCAVFFMDMRTYGKDFERYYEGAKSQGVRFLRSKVHTIDPIAGSDDLSIRYVTDSGDMQTEVFDMVVLSVGLETSPKWSPWPNHWASAFHREISARRTPSPR